MKKLIPICFVAFTSSIVGTAQTNIAPKDASKYVGEKVTVCGKTSGSKHESSRPTLLYLGSGSSTNQVNIVFNQEDLKNFPYKPDEYLANRNVCVTGKVADQNGKPEITVRKPESIKVDEDDVEIKPLSIDGINRYFDED